MQPSTPPLLFHPLTSRQKKQILSNDSEAYFEPIAMTISDNLGQINCFSSVGTTLQIKGPYLLHCEGESGQIISCVKFNYWMGVSSLKLGKNVLNNNSTNSSQDSKNCLMLFLSSKFSNSMEQSSNSEQFQQRRIGLQCDKQKCDLLKFLQILSTKPIITRIDCLTSIFQKIRILSVSDRFNFIFVKEFSTSDYFLIRGNPKKQSGYTLQEKRAKIYRRLNSCLRGHTHGIRRPCKVFQSDNTIYEVVPFYKFITLQPKVNTQLVARILIETIDHLHQKGIFLTRMRPQDITVQLQNQKICRMDFMEYDCMTDDPDNFQIDENQSLLIRSENYQLYGLLLYWIITKDLSVYNNGTSNPESQIYDQVMDWGSQMDQHAKILILDLIKNENLEISVREILENGFFSHDNI